jgi:hypothetical protein
MKVLFLKLFRDPTVRRAALALALAVGAALGLNAMGCASLTPAQQKRVDLFVCRAAALEPVVGEVLDAEELLRKIYAGEASLSSALGTLDATPAEIAKIRAALAECDGEAPPGATARNERAS